MAGILEKSGFCRRVLADYRGRGVVDVISRLIGERVRKRLMTTPPEETRTNWEVFWNFLSRVYGEYDHFSEAQAKVVECKPKEWDTPYDFQGTQNANRRDASCMGST